MGFSLFFNCILMPNRGFNYSQMPNYRFLMDSNAFWMDSGTSIFLSKSGPMTLPIVRKILQQIQGKIWEHPWKMWIWDIWESENLKISGSPVYQTSSLFLWTIGLFFFCFLFLFFDFIICGYDEMMKNRRWGISWDSFCRRNFLKSLDMNLVSIKKHESIFRRNQHFFYFWAM